MAEREYALASGGKERIEITRVGDVVRVRVVVTDCDGFGHGTLITMPISDLQELFRESDAKMSGFNAAFGARQKPDRN